MKTVNLELSKQLKEAGYPQESYFFWNKPMYESYELVRGKNEIWEEEFNCASPTADEILDQLPVYVDIPTSFETTKGLLWIFKIHNGNGKWYVEYEYNDHVHVIVVDGKEADTLADAAAKMWLYLKREGLL